MVNHKFGKIAYLKLRSVARYRLTV